MLEWLENSAVARLVQESLWGYPIVLSTHAVGMAILAGIVLMINFRVLGLAPLISLSGLKTMYRVAWAGFVINLVSGLMLFVSNADAFVQSTPFLLKMALLVLGLVLLVMMARRIFAVNPLFKGEEAPGPVKTMAAVSTVAWIGVIVMGRLIAYWDWTEF